MIINEPSRQRRHPKFVQFYPYSKRIYHCYHIDSRFDIASGLGDLDHNRVGKSAIVFGGAYTMRVAGALSRVYYK